MKKHLQQVEIETEGKYCSDDCDFLEYNDHCSDYADCVMYGLVVMLEKPDGIKNVLNYERCDICIKENIDEF